MIFTPEELLNNQNENVNYSDLMLMLFEAQKNEWELLSQNYEALKNVKTKSYQFDGFKIKAQYNPARTHSTSAKTDATSINNRKCFLCNGNLPKEQNSINYKKKYFILCNPYPVFPKHFTIAATEHIPQGIRDTVSDMLDLSRDISGHFTLLYNGPECGASAPDHLHFQAGDKFFLPVDDEFHQIKNEYGDLIFEDDELSFYAIDDGIRKLFSIESLNKELVLKSFYNVFNVYAKLMNEDKEPKMNIECFYEEEFGWRVLIFIRAVHRPKIFFADENERIVFSPAVIDVSGLCVFPRLEDFERMDKNMLADIFREVFVSKKMFEELSRTIKKSYQ